MRVRHLHRAASLLLVLAASCEVPAPSAPAVESGLVVFAVLDPGVNEQVFLLMRSRSAKPDTTARPVIVDDPIVSSGETPVSGATVVIYSPAGDSAVAVEDGARRPDHLGAGVYRVWGTAATASPGALMPIIAGRRYRLRVASSVGDAEGTTLVPSADRIGAAAARNVSLARDTVLMPASVINAAGYVYSLRSTNGNAEGDPQYRRDLERRLVLPSGGDDWAFAYARDRLRTGSRHSLTVTAADSNYFDYFGAQSDPFADRTARTTLRGAAGVFGSVLIVFTQSITVSSGS